MADVTTAHPAEVDLEAKTGLTAAQLAAAIGVTEPRAVELLEVVAELVGAEAPGAPAAVRREATIRCAGWLAEAPAAGIKSEADGEIRTAYSPAMPSALRASGAKALLAPWKVRRAGAI